MAYGSITLVDVTEGLDGINTATIYLYQRSSTTPTKPQNSLVYNFANQTLSGNLGNWSGDIGSLTGSNPIWITAAVASSNGASDQIESADWSTPIKMAENGEGVAGVNRATVNIYRRDSSTPSQPANTSYNFESGTYTVPNGWYTSIPTTNGNPCWVTSAIAISRTNTATLEWVSPSILVEDGSDGFSPTVTQTSNGVKIVDKDGHETYITNGANGTSYYTYIKYASSANPSDDDISDSPTGKTYIGVYSGTATTAPTTASSYVWSKYVGENGQPATQYYAFVKYATNENGSNMQDSPDSTHIYVGTYTGTSSSPAASAYQWSKYVGDPGQPATQYYAFIRYATSNTGTNMTDTPTANTKYVGTYAGTNSSPAASDYKWSVYVGTNGVSVTGVKEVYYLTTGSAPAQSTLPNGTAIVSISTSTNEWTTVVPTYVANGKYYTSLQTSLSAGTSPIFSTIVLNQGLTDANYNSSEALSVATDVVADAHGALSIARDVRQHFFWFSTDVSTGIPAGAYVAEEAEDTFKAGPSKGNLLTRSDGIWIRKGTATLASLLSTGLQFFVPSGTLQGKLGMSLDASALKFYNIDATNSVAATLSANGLQITNGSITLGGSASDKSSIANGSIALTNSTFTREINGTSRVLQMAIGSKFGVGADGTLYSSGLESVVSRVDDIEDWEIGGRNLFKNSETLDLAWTKDNGSVSDGIATITCVDSGSARLYQMPANGYWGVWKADQYYSVSIDAKASANGLKFYFGAVGLGKYSDHIELTTEWKRYTWTISGTSVPTPTGSMSFYSKPGQSGTIQFRKPKLEYGNKTTDWTLAPEDMDAKITELNTSITQNAEAIKLEATRRESSINILLDADAPSLEHINGPANRYWSNSDRTEVTCSIVEISDAPEPYINYAARFVCDGTNTSYIYRGFAFYNVNDTTSLPLKVGTKYTATWWARCTSGTGGTNGVYRYKETSNRNILPTSFSYSTNNLSSSWKLFTGTIELESIPTDYIRIWFHGIFPANTVGVVELCGFKLVAGDNVEAYSTQILQTADNVLIKATKTGATDAEKEAGGRATIESLINVAPEGVQISADKVNITGTTIFNAVNADSSAKAAMFNSELEIGGRNLLLGTSNADTWTISLNSSNYQAHDCYQTCSPVPSLFAENDLVTISFDWSTTGTSGNFHPECGKVTPYTWGTVVNATGTRTATSYMVDITSSNNSGHVSVTYKVTSAQVSAAESLQWLRIRVDGAGMASKTFTISNAKVERGNKATDWTPAPEDVQSEIDAKKSVHTLMTANSAGANYTAILSLSVEGYTGNWGVISTNGVKVGDTVRIGYPVSDMSMAVVYVVGTVTAINSATSLTMTSHGLDTTVIDGGNILANSIGANQIAANSIGATHLTISDSTNLATANEIYASSLPTNLEASQLAAISGGYLIKKSATQQYLMVTDFTSNNFKQNDELYYEFYGKAATAGTIYINAWGYTGTPPTHTYSHSNGVSISLTTSEAFYSGTISLTNANWATATQYLLGFNDSRSTKSQIYIKKLIIRRKSGGELIVDGSITADKISAGAVTIGKIDTNDAASMLNSNIEIGGRNLCLASNNIVTKDLSTSGTVTTFGYLSDYGKTNLTVGTNVVLSFDAKASTAGLKVGGRYIRNSSGDPVTTVPEVNVVTLTTGWVRYTAEFSISATGADRLGFYTGGNTATSGTVYVRNAMVEVGNKATDWTPAPEDVAAGGKNLLRGSAFIGLGSGVASSCWANSLFYKSGTGGSLTSYTSITDSPEKDVCTCIKATISTANTGVGIAQSAVPVPKGNVTLSVWVKGTSGDIVRVQPIYDDSTETPETTNNYKDFTIPDSNWHRYSHTYTVKYDRPNGCRAGYVYVKSATVGREFLICAPMLEVGSNASDWTPAPQDYGNGINLVPWPYYRDSVTTAANKPYVSGGITWTVNADGSITATGTATAASYYHCSANWDANNTNGTYCLPSGTYTLSGCPPVSDRATCAIQLSIYSDISSTTTTDVSGRTNIYDYGDGVIFTITAPAYVRIHPRIYNGIAIPSGGYTFRPMLEQGAVKHAFSSPRALEGASQTATKYITRISDTGIEVHPSTSTGNDFVRIDGTAIQFYRNNVSMAGMTDTDVRLGDNNAQHTRINSSGMTVYNGSETTANNIANFGSSIRLGVSTGQRVTLSSSALEMYDQNNQRRVRVNSTDGVIIGRPDKGHAVMTDTGFDVVGSDGATSVAYYGETARIGKAGSQHINIDSSGLTVYTGTESNSTNVANFGASSARIGAIANSKTRLELSSTAMSIISRNSSGTDESIASFGSTIKIGKEASAHINITSGGLDLYKGTTSAANLVAHLGYGASSSTTDSNTVPYFTLGNRATSNGVATTVYVPGNFSVCVGQGLIGKGSYSFATGYRTEAVGDYSVAEGTLTYAIGVGSHSEGSGAYARGDGSHAGGTDSETLSTAPYSFAHGNNVIASANGQAVFGKYNVQDTNALFIIGNGTGNSARSNLMTVGNTEVKIGNTSGGHTIIQSSGMQVYGSDGTVELANIGYGNGKTEAGGTTPAPYYTLGARRSGDVGNYSMATGLLNIASGYASTANGWRTTASGAFSSANGFGTIAQGAQQTVIGKANIADSSSLFIVGNGTYTINDKTGAITYTRANAFKIDSTGNIYPQNTKMADFVTEQGTSGIWTYRKWNSGISECWGYQSKSASGVGVNFSMYFPTNLFTSNPTAICSAGASGETDAGVHYVNATTGYIDAWVQRSQSTTNSIWVYAHVLGRWK